MEVMRSTPLCLLATTLALLSAQNSMSMGRGRPPALRLTIPEPAGEAAVPLPPGESMQEVLSPVTVRTKSDALLWERPWRVIACTLSKRGMRREPPEHTRKQMQDIHVIRRILDGRRDILSLVLDGHTSDRAARIARKRIPQALRSQLERMAQSTTAGIRAALFDAYLEADSTIGPDDGGTTATGVYIGQDPETGDPTAFFGTTGDSLSELYDLDGTRRFATPLHQPTTPEEAARLRGLSFGSRVAGLAVSRSLGDHTRRVSSLDGSSTGLIPDPDTASIALNGARLVLQTSDGVSASTAERAALIAQIFQEAGRRRVQLTRLVGELYQNSCTRGQAPSDDATITAMLVEPGEPEPPLSPIPQLH